MGGTENNSLITLFILLLTISHDSLLLNSAIAVNPSGFSMKIIHSDSKESPLYPGDHLTQEERLQRLVQQSKNRARYLGLRISSFNRTTNSINPDVRLPLEYEVSSFYVALVGIGNFPDLLQPFKNYYLMVDSGSELIWIQCKAGDSGHGTYFHQDEPLYPATASSTLETLLCNEESSHPLCYPGMCNSGLCSYELGYVASSVTTGYLVKEKFTVYSDNDALQSLDIIMGCGLHQVNFEPYIGTGYQHGNPDIITGILGINRGPRSFLSQLGPGVDRKFSYCLKPYTDGMATSTYLRFGSDARIGDEGHRVYTTPMFYHPRDPGAYCLNLEDISISGNRIRFQPRDFEYKEDIGRGGTFIDSGTPVTILHEPLFDRVADRVVTYFRELNIHPTAAARRRSYFNLCFAKPKKNFAYPTMTYHFQGAADFVLDNPDTMFSITDNDFCLGLLRSESPYDVIFGAMQQARKRILYDVSEESLLFAIDECEMGS